MEKVFRILDQANVKYTSLCLSGKWTQTTKRQSRFVASYVKCDNCLGNHFINNCTMEKNPEVIEKNKAARLASYSGRGGGRSSGQGGRGGRGGRGNAGDRGSKGNAGDNYGQHAWKKPADNETVRNINGKAYAACKHHGWNCGEKAHTTGACPDSEESGYTIRADLAELLEDNGGNRGKNKASSRASKRGKSKKRGTHQFASTITVAKKM